MKRISNIGYYISEGFHNIFTHGLSSVLSIALIVACLVIIGSFSLVAVNMAAMLGDLERDNEFLAYVEETLTEEEVAQVGERLRAIPNVASADFVTRQEAKEAYIAKYGDSENADLFAELPDDTFRDRYRIHVVDIEGFSQTVAAVRDAEGVAGAQAAAEVAQGFVTVRNVAVVVAGALAAMLLVMSMSIISNATKLAAFTRRDEISIMKMMGATDAFIRWPFIFEGMILGLTGALLAFFVQWGVYKSIEGLVGYSDTIQLITVIPFLDIAPLLAAVFGGVGLLVGVVGSAFTIGKSLQV